MTHPKALLWTQCNSKGADNGRRKGWVCSLVHNTLGVKGRVGALGWGIGRLISNSHGPAQTKQQIG
jgi:hypothetical protein